ncbi:MAG: hypothetical protein KDH99_12870, partial [Alcanivoracaceae bacterium]|nr:hypothetical protein [Alcanivoracaceae bacterium]
MRKTWLLFSQAVTVTVAALFVLATLKPQWLGAGSAVLPRPTLTVVATDTSPPDTSASAPGGGYSAAARAA